MTTESNGNSESMQAASAQQTQEQVVALTTDADAAEARSAQALENFKTVCAQAAQHLNLNPQTPQGAILQQALSAAFQWGGEAANASDHAVQRRKEVDLLRQIATAQEAELKESRERRAQARDESSKRTAILDRLATSTEKQGDELAKIAKLVDVLGPLADKQKKTSVGAGA